MRIIDRYLLRQFVQIFMICFLSLTGLFVVFDAFSNLDEFIKNTGKQSDLLATMGEYYAYRSIFFFERTSGVLALVAAMFTLTWLERHNELTSLYAAGVSARRVVAPIILAAAAVSLVGVVSREFVIPQIQLQLSRNPKDLQGEIRQVLSPRYDNKTDILIRGHHTLAAEKKITDPNFLLPQELSHVGKQIVGESAFYQPPAKSHPGGYLFTGVQQPVGLCQRSSVSLDDEPVIITPHDEPDWLEPNQCFVVSEVTFEQLTGGHNWKQFSSTATLIAGLRNSSLDFGADVRVAIHARFLRPFLDVTLLCLGIPLVIGRENRNVFMSIGLCLVVVSAFMLLVLGSHYLGAIYLLDPALAAWLPLVIFVPLAVFLSEPLLA